MLEASAQQRPAPLVSGERLITAGILLAPVVVIFAAFAPGVLNIDMQEEIREVETGVFTNHHAPLLHAMWSPLWESGFGPGWVLVAQLLVFVAGAYLVLRSAFTSIPAALLTAAIALSPPVIGELGTLLRDTWFAALLLLTFGLVVRAAQSPWPAQGRYLALAVAAAWLTLATRQNAAAAVVLACIVIAALLIVRRRTTAPAPRTEGRRGRLRLVAGSVAGGIALTLALMATQLGAAALLGVRDVHPESTLFIYDVAAISERERENLFPADVMPRRGIGVIDRKFTTDSIHSLTFFDPAPIPDPLSDERAESLRDAWWRAVRQNPGAYLDARWDLWWRQISVTSDARWPYPRADSENGGFPLHFPSLNESAVSYLDVFGEKYVPFFEPTVGGPVFSVWAYLFTALLGAVLLLRRGRPWPLLAVGALALAALTHQVGLFFGAMVNTYRFEFPCVVIGIVVGAVLLRLGSLWWREKRPEAHSPATARQH